MTESLPAPPIPADCDLRGLPFTPIFRARLFGSAFHARATDAEWRAGFTLWLKSWDQFPGGSLPEDDIELCRLAELGRDHRAWKKVKEVALHGWTKCSDGRLYHQVVTEGVIAAWGRRATATAKGKAGAYKRWSSANAQALPGPMPQPGEDDATAIAVVMPGDSKGQGQGQGERKGSEVRTSGGEVPPDDPVKGLFDRGLSLLGSGGRSLLGKARREYGDLAVLSAIAKCESEKPSDPAGFFFGCLKDAKRRGVSDGVAPFGSPGFA